MAKPAAPVSGKSENKKASPAKPGAVAARAKKPARGFLADDPIALDTVASEAVERCHHQKLLALVFSQTLAIAALAAILLFGAPFMRPVYQYYALDPSGRTMPMASLAMPNMTNQAVLSWATGSVTEIMTIGFGDFEHKLMGLQPRFTSEGWTSFRDAFNKQKIGEQFQKHQLVLTTVPSNTPVILSQGQNPDRLYQWKVQVPVVMTYATNNNVTRRERAVIELTIVRVPAARNAGGIAIKVWSIKM